jgi:hypothetical protein
LSIFYLNLINYIPQRSENNGMKKELFSIDLHTIWTHSIKLHMLIKTYSIHLSL